MSGWDLNAKHWASIILGLAVMAIALAIVWRAPDVLAALPGAIVMVLAAIQPLLTLFSPAAIPAVNRAAVLKHDSLFPPPMPDSPLPTLINPTDRPPPPPPKAW